MYSARTLYFARRSGGCKPPAVVLSECTSERTTGEQQRGCIDLAKRARLVPVIGAAVGAVATYRLIDQLGTTATNCYRPRHFAAEDAASSALLSGV